MTILVRFQIAGYMRHAITPSGQSDETPVTFRLIGVKWCQIGGDCEVSSNILQAKKLIIQTSNPGEDELQPCLCK